MAAANLCNEKADDELVCLVARWVALQAHPIRTLARPYVTLAQSGSRTATALHCGIGGRCRPAPLSVSHLRQLAQRARHAEAELVQPAKHAREQAETFGRGEKRWHTK